MRRQLQTSVVFGMIAALAVFAACGPAEKAYDQQAAAPAPEAAEELPPVAALIVHRVADYDAWKVVFDDHAPARKAAGCLGHHLNRGVDDPNMVYLYVPATDAARLEAFLASEDLEEAMTRAGVLGPPSITLMKTMSDDHVPDQLLPGIVVIHPVQDYDTWRVAYDEFDEYRKAHGIVGHAVNQEVGNPNQVIVYHQANDMDALRAFVDSTELKETMERAGVIGTPDIRFVRVADFADY